LLHPVRQQLLDRLAVGIQSRDPDLHGSDDLFGPSDDLFGLSDDLFGLSDDLFGLSDDLFGLSDDLFGPSKKPPPRSSPASASL
jgi:hypothetical protein